MTFSKFFPSLLTVLDLFAALVYLKEGDIGRASYWLMAGGLTYSVTWMIK